MSNTELIKIMTIECGSIGQFDGGRLQMNYTKVHCEQREFESRVEFLRVSVEKSKDWRELEAMIFALDKEKRALVFEDLVDWLDYAKLKPSGTVGQQVKRFFNYIKTNKGGKQ
jgi:hypothetical protein